MKDRDDWDSVMLEDYLASIEIGVGDEQVLEIRRKVLDRTDRTLAKHETRTAQAGR